MRHSLPAFEFRRRARAAMKPVMPILLIVALLAALPSLINDAVVMIADANPSTLMTDFTNRLMQVVEKAGLTQNAVVGEVVIDQNQLALDILAVQESYLANLQTFIQEKSPLLAGLVMGHFAHIGPVSISVPKKTLDVVRELGLALFLMGAGTGAGKGFLAILSEYGAMLFLLGALMTIIPMVVGYIIATKVFKIDILSSMGSICGGMTSTPALGALIASTKTEAVAVSYAATYPLALIMVVLCCEFIPLLF